LGFIGCLHVWQTVWVAGEPGFDHIGEKHTTQCGIDRRMQGGRHLAHGDGLERLPAAQQLAVDLGDRL
jgi:hypothetical protein